MCAWECCGMLRFGFPWLSERLPAGWSRAFPFLGPWTSSTAIPQKSRPLWILGFIQAGYIDTFEIKAKKVSKCYIFTISGCFQLPFWLFVGLVLACFRPWFKPTHRFRTPHYVWPRIVTQCVGKWFGDEEWRTHGEFGMINSAENCWHSKPASNTLLQLVHWMGFRGFGTTTGLIPPSATPGVSFAPGAVWSSSAHLGLQSIFGTTRNAHVPLAANGYCETARQETEH